MMGKDKGWAKVHKRMKKKGIGERSQVEMEVWGWRHKERRATKALWFKKKSQ